MKPITNPKSAFHSHIAATFSAVLFAHFAAPAAFAIPYYWDGNDVVAGFGTAGGTWAAPTAGTTTSGWSTSTTGAITVDGNSVTTATSDTTFFGNGATGLATGSIAVDGTVDTGNMTFASGSGPITLTGGIINMVAAASIVVNSSSHTISSELAGAATSFIAGGGGTLVLNGANTFAGPVTLGNNVAGLKVQINTLKNVGAGASSLGAPADATAGIIQIGMTSNNATVEFIGATAAASTDRQVRIGRNSTGSGGTIILNNNADPTYTLTFSNPAFNVAASMGSSGGGRFLTLGGSNTGNNTIAGALKDNTGSGVGWPVGLSKIDSGTWVLTGANTYTRSTTVSAGTLALDASDVLPNSTPVSLGAGTLAIGAGFNDTTGTLDVTGAATINLGTGAALAFANSSGVNLGVWAGTLNFTGTFVPGNGVDPEVDVNPGSLRFGTTSAGLTADQLDLISVNGSGAGTCTLDSFGYLVAGAVSGYAAWQSANFTSQTADLDHDNDGVSNGVEFFLGGTGNTTGFTALPGVTDTAGVLSVTWVRHPDYPGFPANYGTDFCVETSATLADPWTLETTTPGNVTISSNNVIYTFPAGTMNFARLKVTVP